MKIIEPHIHMVSRTTDDYQAMYKAGIRVCVEPSFWLGARRRYAGTFFDYFNLILEFETVRAERFGLDHYAAVSVNPKESEDVILGREVLAGIDEYIEHERCIAIGEIGFNELTDNEELLFRDQLKIAEEKDMLVIVHLPHMNKKDGIDRTLRILDDFSIPREHILIDHNTEETMPRVYGMGFYLGMTVYPISKLSSQRVSDMIRQYGHEQILVSGSADWGISNPLSLVDVVNFLHEDGHSEETIDSLVFNSAMSFYSGSPKWKPRFDLVPVDVRTFQR